MQKKKLLISFLATNYFYLCFGMRILDFYIRYGVEDEPTAMRTAAVSVWGHLCNQGYRDEPR